MAQLLKDAQLEEDPIDDLWVDENRAVHSDEVLGQAVELHRTLRALTDGEARQIAQSAMAENGLEAWRALHLRFGLATAAKMGAALTDVTIMTHKPAKNPAETRVTITELERRVRIAEDLTGVTMDDNWLKSVLAVLVDPLTRAHTTKFLGPTKSYQELKRAVLEFSTNNTGAKPAEATAMDLSQFVESAEATVEDESWEDLDDPALNAVTSMVYCHKCGGAGHVAPQCPSQLPKGKGKGPSKGKGKGPTTAQKGQPKGSGKG